MKISNLTQLSSLLILAGTLSIWTPSSSGQEVTITGKDGLLQWHNVTLTLSGPQASETGTPNPFLDYRFNVTFQHPATGLTYQVPGYFAADGNAANSSSTSGNKWRAHLSPDHTGTWNYKISFRKGKHIAVSSNVKDGEAVKPFDGLSGKFKIEKTNKKGRDLRAKGRLSYVGKHHLQFQGNKEYFLKCGADAPENFLAYQGFDGDFKTDGHKDNLIKTWGPHIKDWKPGDPTWKDGQGKGIIGAINYLASQGLNVFSFITLNIDGDDRNVFPYLNYKERERIDCSRMDQWAIVFEHGNNIGMYLHFKTMETENELLLDKGNLGTHRKLYYRELIARFSHNLALNWNLGEEINNANTQQKAAWADYFATNDPYTHHIVIHNMNVPHYDLLGDASKLTGFSLQTSRPDFRNVHSRTLDYINRSIKAGKPWVVACDEPGDAQHALITDKERPRHDNARKNALWGNIMAGGAGVEWYFGYQHPHSDLTCQDYRSRENMWVQCRYALEFFSQHNIPFWDMKNANAKISTKNGYCLFKKNEVYLVYLKEGGRTQLDLTDTKGIFEILWYNPREGGELKTSSTLLANGGTKVTLEAPSNGPNEDWLAYVRPGDPNRDYPPSVAAGNDRTVMLPKNKNSVTIELNGKISDDNKSNVPHSARWSKVSGKGKVEFEAVNKQSTRVTLEGAGTYQLKLMANDGNQSTEDTLTIVVEPFQSRVTRSLRPIDDAFIEGNRTIKSQHLKVEGNRRIAYLKFNLPKLPPKILDLQLKLTEAGDTGRGQFKVHLGSHSNWTSTTLTKESAPKAKTLIEARSVNASNGSAILIPVMALAKQTGVQTLILSLAPGGNDIWFSSTRGNASPQLLITFEDDDGTYSNIGESAQSPPRSSSAPQPSKNSLVLSALNHFKSVAQNEFVPAYRDEERKALAINAALYQGKFAAAESQFKGKKGIYDIVLSTMTETDGESSYRLLVKGNKIGEVQNPESDVDYKIVNHRFKNISLSPGDSLRVEFNSHSNGKIPEGDAFAFSRGRWQSLILLKPGASLKKGGSSSSKSSPTPTKPTVPFKLTYNPKKAKKVHVQTDGMLVVEAENYDAVDRQKHRTWYLTTQDKTPNVKPDPDPNHAKGASGGAYLELLPDTRVTHGDPLVNGVSFTNTPGQCSVLYYPVIIKKPGRYYVWVRMCCTGSEDNGLHVGIDGKWPASGARLQFTGKHGQWQWDSRQRTQKVHTGVLGQIWLDIDQPGLHTIMFSMREDGFEFDKFLLTQSKASMKSKTTVLGPKASPMLKK